MLRSSQETAEVNDCKGSVQELGQPVIGEIAKSHFSISILKEIHKYMLYDYKLGIITLTNNLFSTYHCFL